MKGWIQRAALPAVLLTAAHFAWGAEKEVTVNELPPAVRETVKQQTEGAKLLGLSKEGDRAKTTYEAHMTVNGRGKDVKVDLQGRVIATGQEIDWQHVPEPARAAIHKSSGGAKLVRIELVKEKTRSYYEVAVKRGANTSDLRVDPQGKILP